MRWPSWKFPVIVSVVLILLAIFGTTLVLTHNRKSRTTAKAVVFDSRLSIFWAQMLIGSDTYYLPKGGNVFRSQGPLGSRLEGKLRAEIRQLGIDIDTLPAFRAGNGINGRAFLVGYAFPVPPKSTEHLMAEVVADDGTVYQLRSAAGGGGGPPQRSWNLWILDSLPPAVTNYALQLRAQTNGAPVAEIRFVER